MTTGDTGSTGDMAMPPALQVFPSVSRVPRGYFVLVVIYRVVMV